MRAPLWGKLTVLGRMKDLAISANRMINNGFIKKYNWYSFGQKSIFDFDQYEFY